MNNRPNILVADRDKNILSAFSNFLRKKKYSMTAVSNVNVCLKEILQQDYNLLITDVRQDSEFDINFIKRVKSAKNNLPIIALTSYPDKINETEIKSYGVAYLFIKPLELYQLNEAIKDCIKYSLQNINDHHKNN